MAERDWYDWHAPYEDPSSGLSLRLTWVQDRIRAALDEAPAGPIRVISMCAGQGHDVLGALLGHPRRGDVTARLVELDPRNTEAARKTAAASGLDNVEVVTGDAALTSQYTGLTPANVVLACGMFGNMTDGCVERVISYCTQLCAAGGTVIWTRARSRFELGGPAPVPQACAWFEERGFDRVWVSDPGYEACCGAHRFTASPAPLEPDATMFTFRPFRATRPLYGAGLVRESASASASTRRSALHRACRSDVCTCQRTPSAWAGRGEGLFGGCQGRGERRLAFP